MHMGHTGSRRWALKILVVSGILAAVGLISLYLMRARAILYSDDGSADPVGESSFSIFNPFRDHSPERTAEAFLEALRLGQCVQVIARLAIDQSDAQYICSKETEHPLRSWQLRNRHDEPEKVKMFYWHWRANPDYHDRLWVTVEKHSGQWQVVNYECIY